MARPFDENMSYQQMSSISSQTSLAGPYDEYGSYTSKRVQKRPSKKGQRPSLPKIKSSPSHGALAAARASHGKLHKRGNSTSTTPTSPTYLPDYLLQTASATIPAAHVENYSPIEKPTKSKVKIKPLLQKFSSTEIVSIDLSRSAAENEGLGIYTSSEIRVPSSIDSASARKGYHSRAISGASQISTTTTSSGRYGAQYVHPMRQTPRPYTPPLAASYKTSLDSETPVTSLSEHDTTSYAPLPSTRRLPPPLHIPTGSSSRAPNSSQTNLPGTPSSLRLHTDLTSPDMASPTTRSSLESAFRKRSRSNTATTPAEQAAAVQLLRQKFQEREAAKDLKYQQAEARARDKEQRRTAKRQEDERRSSEKKERKRARSNATSEKSSLRTFGRETPQMHQDDLFPAAPDTVDLFPTLAPVPYAPARPQRGRGDTAGSKTGKAARSQWSLFWFRFRTVWLKVKRSLSGGR